MTSARGLTTVPAVGAELARHPSGYVLTGLLASALLVRRRLGRVVPQDAVALVAVAAAQPFVEWALHRYVLHARPASVAGHVVDPGASHRAHHAAPDDVAGALLGARYAVADGVGVAALAAGVGALTTPFATRVPVRGMVTAAGVAVGGLARYEWCHLVLHSGCRPRTARLRRLRAHHMAHHHRDERAWFGITSDLADRLFGTAPGRVKSSGAVRS